MPPAEKKSKYFPKFKEELPSVAGKVFVITGTTSGTGFIAARTVVEKGGEVVCLNRKSQRVEDATAKLQEAATAAKIVNIECDLQDFASVRNAAEQVKSKYKKIYCVSFNAGIAGQENKATKDGCEVMMQTNHLSHFILAKELLPLLEAQAQETGDARIVTHSSGARDMTANKRLEKKYLEKKGGDPELGDDGKSFVIMGGRMYRYAQTKLANSVMMHALHEKLQAKGSKVRSISCHPGASLTSMADGMDELPFLDRLIFKAIMVPFVFQSAEDGTMGLLHAMMANDAKSGELYGPVGKGNMAGPPVLNPSKPHETDPEIMKMLWETSEETTGIKFDV